MSFISYKNVLVLTKSFKNKGYCVAGIDLDKNKFIRIVKDSEGGALSAMETESISPLSVVSFNAISSPLNDQIENVILVGAFNIIRKEEINIVKELYFNNSFNNTGLIYNEESVLDKFEMQCVNSSLSIAFFTNMEIYKNKNQRFRARFIYNDVEKNFSMTDPEYCYQDCKISEGLMIVSIPSLNNHWNNENSDQPYHKFIAKIFDFSLLS